MVNAPHITEETADEYAIGALEPELARAVALHIADCRPCREIVHRSEATAAALALASPVRKASPRLRSRVERAAGIERSPWAARIVRLAPAGAAAAAVIVAVIAFTGLAMLRGEVNDLRGANIELQEQVDEALSQQVQIASLQRRLSVEEQRSFELDTAARGDRDLLLTLLLDDTVVAGVYSPEESSAFGRLVWSPQSSTLYFVADHLSPRPADETYQVWVSREGRYVSLGTFRPDESGFARFQAFLPNGIDAYQSAIVTVERPGTISRSGDSVFVADLLGLLDD